ncbi:MAG: hypothetical protein AABY22_23040, partial [Nanoarchaeota archaeon]
MLSEEKLKIIDSITDRHPGYGIKKGWSWYHGGMEDRGDWYIDKMLIAGTDELNAFLQEIIKQENAPKEVLTEQEEKDSKIMIDLEVD